MKAEVRPCWIYRDLCLSIMGKDSYWFRHDSNAGRGLKMRKMAHIYGHWGKGIYWDVVEILRDQENYKFQSDESSLQLLCDLVGCKDEKRFLNWFNDSLRIGLFELSETYFICPPLLENMEVWETKKNNGSKGGRPPKKTEIKPNIKPNQNHNITEQNIIEYNRTEQNILATEILKQSKPTEFQTFEMQNKKQVNDWDKMLDSFNDKVIIEVANKSLTLEPNSLLARLRTYTRSWITNNTNEVKKEILPPTHRSNFVL